MPPKTPLPPTRPAHPKPDRPSRPQAGAAVVGVTSLALLGLGAAMVHGIGRATQADAVAEWNRIGIDVGDSLERGTAEQRELAMMHLAMHDALQSIRPMYATYAKPHERHPDGLPNAAIAAAAHDVLVATVPGKRDVIDVAFIDDIDELPPGRPRDEGLRAGHEAAHAILAMRAHDGADRVDLRYDGKPGIGAWEPTPPNHEAALVPGWRNVRPFAMQTPHDFRPPPPPALTSAEYARQFNAVKAFGGETTTQRTHAQGDTARFWSGPVNEVWNDIARTAMARHAPRMHDDDALWRNARTFALLNLAMADGFVAGWDGKYTYRYWRPITAIHRADGDGNPATAPDAGWNAFLPTPSHPEYPSTHSVLSGAAAATLHCALGTDRTDVVVTSRGHFAGMQRRVRSFDAVAKEVAVSRVYAGAHFPIANAVGLDVGRRIGELACNRLLAPIARR